MSFEGGNPSPRQERQSLSAEWLKFNIDPTLPLTVRTWITDLTPEQGQNPSTWPKYIKDAVVQHLGIPLDALPSEKADSYLKAALANHDRQYTAAREANVKSVDFRVPENTAKKQEVSEVSVSEPDTELETDIAELRVALKDRDLSTKYRERIASAIARHDAATKETVLVPTESPETASERRKAIRAATNLNELIAVLRSMGDVQTGAEVLSNEDLVEPVARVRNLNVFTRNSLLEDLIVNEISMQYGLRDKVIALLEAPVTPEPSAIEDSKEVPPIVEVTPIAEAEPFVPEAVEADAGLPELEIVRSSRRQPDAPEAPLPTPAVEILDQGDTESGASIERLKEELAILNAGFGNAEIETAQRFGIDTFNRVEASDAIQRLVAEREQEIKRLEGKDTLQPTAESLRSEKKEDVIDIPPSRVEGAAESVTNAEPEIVPQEKQPEKVTASPEAAVGKEGQESNFNERREVSPEAAQLFTRDFKITAEELQSIEGFDALSAAQQKFVHENLSQLALGNVREESARLVSDAVGMRKSEMTENYGKFLGNIMAGTREVFMGGYTKLKTEKDVAARMRTGGLSEHGKVLSELVQNISKYGPRVHERPGGELFVDLLNIRERAKGEARKEEWIAMNTLNSAAHAFAATPAEWRRKTLGVDEGRSKWTRFVKEKVFRNVGTVQESTFEKREAEYTQARLMLEKVLHDKGESDLQIAQTLIELDSRVHQLQTLRTNPDAVQALAEIEDKSFITESVKHFFAGPGAYMALGTIGRTVGGAALGFVGAPIASASVAWLRSWNRTAAELRERDRNARAGVVDKKSGALNVVAAEDAERTVMVDGKPMYNGLTAKLERLRLQTEQATGDQKKRLLEQLRLRVEYVHDKQKLQRVNYGKAEGRVSRQVALTEALAQSLAYLNAQDMTAEAAPASRFVRTKEKAEARLSQKLQGTEREIIELRRVGRRGDAIKSMTVASAFSFAGALFADYFKDDSVFFKKGINASDDVAEASSAVTSGAERPDSLFRGGFEEGTEKGAEKGVLALKETAPYTIQRGDTLIGIMREKIPAIRELGTEATMARENATMNILRDFSSQELRDIGITSGNVNKVYAGDAINMEKLNEAILARKGMIERAIERFGKAPVGGGAPESIPTAASTESILASSFDSENVTPKTAEETALVSRASNDLGRLPSPVDYGEYKSVPESWVSSAAINGRKADILEHARSFFKSEDSWNRIRTMPVSRVFRKDGFPFQESQFRPLIKFFQATASGGLDTALPVAPKGYTVERYLNSFADLLARDLTPREYALLIGENGQGIGGGFDMAPTAAMAETLPVDVSKMETPAFKGGFDGELMTEGTVVETFPLADVAEANKVETIAKPVQIEVGPAVAEASLSKEVIAERKTALMDTIRERYASNKEWKRVLNMRMSDVVRYQGMTVNNPESLAARAQSVMAMRTALEKAGFDTDASQKLFEQSVNGKLPVGAYLEAVTQTAATEVKPEVYEKLLKAIDPETVRATAMEQWGKPEAVATRAKGLQTLFTESLRANDRTAWARWAQGWQSPFSNKSELFLESARQHLISQREEFVDLLKKYKIPFAPQGGESQQESINRFSRLLAEKITPEDIQKLNVS